MPKPITVLVSGATGKQGGAVARQLLERGHHVRALTRRPGSAAAASLHAEGADLCEGDLDDGPAVQRAAEGADAFFLMATPFEEGVAAEVRQGRRAAQAAKDARVRHLVYSSVAGATRDTGIPHFDSKAAVEAFIRELGVPFTIVAPVFFMENLLGEGSLRGLRTGTLSLPLPVDRKLQMIAVTDIAGVVRLALERPTEFRDQRIELAGDELDGRQMAAVLSKATGSRIEYAATPVATVRSQSEDLGRMFEWLDQVGYDVDVTGLRQRYRDVAWHDFGGWARDQDWSVLDEASSEQPTA